MKTLRFTFISFLFLFSTQVFGANTRISGDVTDAKFQGIPDAVVEFVCNGDTTRTTTSASGHYSVVVTIQTVGVEVNLQPDAFVLHQNHPNPFNPTTTIEFDSPQGGNVTIDVYASSGQRIRRLMNGVVDAGRHSVTWDGADGDGRRLGAGVYICRFSAGAYDRAIKMTLVDGGGVSGGGAVPVAKTAASLAYLPFEIIVTKDGYEPYHETGFPVVPDEPSNKDVILSKVMTNLPVADAGPDQDIKVGTLLTLDGSGSKPGDGGALEYHWRASQSNPDDPFIIRTHMQPETGVRVPGTYLFFLAVDEGMNRSKPDTVVVTVHDKENPPFEDYGLELSLRKQLNNPSQDFAPEEIAAVDSLLYCTEFGKLTNLKGIEQMPDLFWLNINRNRLTDISPLANLKKLQHLGVNQNRILQDISPLAGLTALTYLDIESNDISDISPLKDLVNLEFINAQYNPIEDISPLGNMPKLKILYLSRAPITNGLESLSKLTNLEFLWLSGCELTDISDASGCNKVKYLYLSYNMIEDISIIEYMPDIETIYLVKNNVSDILPLVRNPGIGEGDYITLRGNPLSETSINEYIPLLKERGVNITY